MESNAPTYYSSDWGRSEERFDVPFVHHSEVGRQLPQDNPLLMALVVGLVVITMQLLQLPPPLLDEDMPRLQNHDMCGLSRLGQVTSIK